MNRRQTKALVMFVAAFALLAIAIAWTTTSVLIPRGYVLWSVIVAALWTAIPRWPNRLVEGVATGLVIVPTILGLMHYYYTPLTFPSIAWWQGIALYVAAQLVARSVRLALLLSPRSRRNAASA